MVWLRSKDGLNQTQLLILIEIEKLCLLKGKVTIRDMSYSGIGHYQKMSVHVHYLASEGYVVKHSRANTYYSYPLTLTTKGSIVVATAKRILEGRPIRKPSIK